MQSGSSPRHILDRRAVLGGLAAAGGLFLSGPAGALRLPAPQSRQLTFDIRREGASIGRHAVRFSRDGDLLEVDIEIDISVSLALIPLFSYRHRNREVWRDGRLASLDSETDDDGEHLKVAVRRRGVGLWVEGTDGGFLAPADVLPTSYWNPRTVEQSRLLDSQHGRLLAVSPRLIGEERLPGGPAWRYRLSGDLNLDLWYAGDEWAKIAFEVRGAAVSYARRDTMVDDGASG